MRKPVVALVPWCRGIFPEDSIDDALFWELLDALVSSRVEQDLVWSTIERLSPSRESRSARYRAMLDGAIAPLQRRAGVYFVRSGTRGPIKIGCAKKLASRFSELQVGNPETLHFLGSIAGARYEESQLHKRFASVRWRGEWFLPETDLLRFIRTEAG